MLENRHVVIECLVILLKQFKMSFGKTNGPPGPFLARILFALHKVKQCHEGASDSGITGNIRSFKYHGK